VVGSVDGGGGGGKERGKVDVDTVCTDLIDESLFSSRRLKDTSPFLCPSSHCTSTGLAQYLSMRPTNWLAQADTIRRVGKDALKSAFVYQSKASQTLSNTLSGPLAGWHVSIKDNICTTDMPTSCSSKMLLDYQSPFEATAVQLLRQAGASIVAKTNCDEFGMGSANLYSVHGRAVNPESQLGRERVTGGSSGGAAAGVALGASRIALASDTGGSIRTPAAYCGVFGLKPSYGLISRWGVVPYADSLDTVGLMGNDAEQVNTAFKVISQHDVQDPTSVTAQVRGKAGEISRRTIESFGDANGPMSGLRIGIPREFFPAELSKDMLPPLRRFLTDLKRKGADIVSVEMPTVRFALSAYYVLASAEASSNLAKYDGVRYGHRAEQSLTSTISTSSSKPPSPFLQHISTTRSQGFGKEVQKRILLGTYSLTSDLFDNYFLQAQKVRTLIQRDFDQVFRVQNVLNEQRRTGNVDGVDVLVTPSTVDIAPTFEEAERMGIKAYTQDLLTVPASLAGLPAISVPAGRARELPVGITLTGQWGCEEVLFEVIKRVASS
jgi:aspartyl-tRNA(Asn)/glutamyl-tRNA(Gln) amidotransferase subunit A